MTAAMQNLRLIYDAQGREIAPPAIRCVCAAGVCIAEIWCGEYHPHGEASTDAMPAGVAIPDICLRYA